MAQVTVVINGRPYRIGCATGEEARLAELADHLNLRLERLVMDFGQQANDRLLVLAALLATDELLDAKARLARIGDAAEGDIAPRDAVAFEAEELEAAARLQTAGSDLAAQPLTSHETEAVAQSVPIEPTTPSNAQRTAPPARPSLEARLAQARGARPPGAPKSGAA